MTDDDRRRCGTIALAGRPNAGKSTLLNRLVGANIAITSARPQTTRQPVIGIRTDGDVQLVFVDPPGLFDPQHLLQEAMLAEAVDALRVADAVLYVHRLDEGPAPQFQELLPTHVSVRGAVATVLTCADRVGRDEGSRGSDDTFVVSGVSGAGVAEVLTWCRARVPSGPFRYDPTDISAQPVRFFAAEYVREAALGLLREELPHALVVEVDEFREGPDAVYIRATIHVERLSQKGIVIGKDGRTIKAIGAAARRRIEAILDQHVYLDLWVKVLPRWRRSPELLRRFGFHPPRAST